MHRLTRPAEPANLRDHVPPGEFLAEARRIEALPPGERPKATRERLTFQDRAWRNDQVKAALQSMTDDLCSYCESEGSDVAFYGQMDHFRPKSLFPTLAYSWTNLFWACQVCNTSKGAYWPENPEDSLVDPSVEDPEDVIEFDGPWAKPRRSVADAELTIDTLKLNRPGLVNKRETRLKEARLLRDELGAIQNCIALAETKGMREVVDALTVLWQESACGLRRLSEPGSPYSTCVRHNFPEVGAAPD